MPARCATRRSPRRSARSTRSIDSTTTPPRARRRSRSRHVRASPRPTTACRWGARSVSSACDRASPPSCAIDPRARTGDRRPVTGQAAGDKVLVVHPAFSGERVGLDFAIGVQRLVARRLKACGRPAVFALARTRDEDGVLVAAAIESWPEDAVTAMAVEQFECKWVVVPEFAAVDDGCRLTTGLFEVDARRRLRA